MCSEIMSHYVQNYYSLTLLVPSANSVSSLKITSAEWLLRVLYEICRIPKTMLHYRPLGKRSLGLPKKRWIENVALRP